MVLNAHNFAKELDLKRKDENYFMTEEEWDSLFEYIDKYLIEKFSNDPNDKVLVGEYSLFSRFGVGWRYERPYDRNNANEVRSFMRIICKRYKKEGWRVWQFTSDCFQIRIPFTVKLRARINQLKEFLSDGN